MMSNCSLLRWLPASILLFTLPAVAADLPPDLQTPRTLREAHFPSAPLTSAQTPASDAIAQEPTTPTPTPAVSPYTPISPQFGASFDTGPGTGYESSFGSIEGFVPLSQTPGQALTYLNGRFNLDTAEGNPSGNFVVGYRRFNADRQSILGGYLGYDIRNTGRSTFNQLSLGLESVAPTLEVRFNGYLPVGDKRNTVASSVVDTTTGGSGSTSFAFQGNYLALTLPGGQRRTTRVEELSLGGFDLEVGTRLTQWGSDGALRGYLGTYYYDGSGISGFLGVRGRLEARVNQTFRAGLSLQHDKEFGTTAVVSLGAVLGRRSSSSAEQANWARIGDSPYRQVNVAATTRTQTEVVNLGSGGITLATNPATGQPWFFAHVTLGATGGNGTFESPFGTVANGLNGVPTDGNGIVYVAAGSDPGIPAFTIPNNVRVWSRGPVQSLNTVQQGLINLPLSGVGTLPRVTDTVTMGNTTSLSGFAITPPSGNPGVLASAVQTVEVRDNRVQASGNNTPGVRLQNVTGTVTLNNNTIRTTGLSQSVIDPGSHGIEVSANNTALATLTLSNNTLTAAGSSTHGIYVFLQGSSSIATATFTNNTITTAGLGGSGIFLAPSDTSSITTATLTNNTVTTSGGSAHGIFVPPFINSSIGTLTINNNTSTTTGANANSIQVASQGGRINSIEMTNNRTPQSGGSSNIQISNNSSQPFCARISGNQTGSFASSATPANFALSSGGRLFRVIDLASLSANNNSASFRYDNFLIPSLNFINVATCP